ncbi:putative Prefoldin subunit [Trypanosoma vivax]|uniref:Putative prefoldin n=1 Tax=Trypanosoma vivax (strain Y486) TaxID=1055687 RepID=G0TY65_TRYVY|nr:putative prefoldin [Trypanosoma vivax]KAH8618805.1 putative Prefoldin subunit [Trypanosoma vivax]CCC48910.1 putative prefoldin [Trypanosoma vivax Y486]
MSGRGESGGGGAINVMQLPLENLVELRKQLQLDVQSLSSAYDGLRDAHGRFVSNREVLDDYKKVCDAARAAEDKCKQEGKDPVECTQEALICMGSALYVMGRIVPNDRVLVDVGTDYFVEKPMDAAAMYFSRRAESVQENMDSVEQMLRVKQMQLGQVLDAIRVRQAQIQQQQQSQQQ